MFAHVVTANDLFIFNGLGSVCLPPHRFRHNVEMFLDPIKATVDDPDDPKAYLLYQTCFLQHYLACVKEVLEPTLPELRNMDGDKLTFTVSKYSFSPAMKPAVVKTLKSMRNIDHDYDEDGKSYFAWNVTRHDRPVPDITKAHITVHASMLETECNSRKRDRDLRKRLLRDLADFLEYDDTTHQPFDPHKHGPGSEHAKPIDLDTLSEEDRKSISAAMEQQFLRWADQVVPALQGKSPRQAVKTFAGRKEVTAMINDWENMHSRTPNPGFSFDFNRLRSELGLEVE